MKTCRAMLEAAQLGVGEGAFWVAFLESRRRADCCPIGYGRPSISALKSSQPSEARMECQSRERLNWQVCWLDMAAEPIWCGDIDQHLLLPVETRFQAMNSIPA